MLDLVIAAIRNRRMNRAMSEEIAGDVCIACNGRNLEELGPEAYRCNDCGYEGGPGQAQLMESERQRAFEEMSPLMRIQSAREDLRFAQSLLQASIGTLESSRQTAVRDLVGIGALTGLGGEVDDRQNLLMAALGDYEHARRAVLDASFKLGLPGTIAAFESDDISFENWMIDGHSWSRFYGARTMMDTIETARLEAAALLLEVDDFLERFPSDDFDQD